MAPPGTYSASIDGPEVGLYPTASNINGQHTVKALKTDAHATPAARQHGVEAEKGALPEALESWRANLRGNDTLVLPRPKSWWTGKQPQATPGFCVEDGSLTSLPLPVLSRSHARLSILIAAWDRLSPKSG